MITVQSVKSTTPASQPTREDYVEEEQEKRRFLPLAFVLFLTTCAAYLKTFLPVKLEAQEDRQNHNDADEQSDPSREDEVSAAAEEDVTTGASDPAAKSSDNVVPIRMVLPQEIGDFLANDSPALDFKGLERPGLVRIEGGPTGDAIRPVNDNRPPAQSNPDGAGGPSPSSGSSPDDRQPPPDTRDNPSEPGGGTPGGIPPDPARNRAPRTSGPVHLQDLAGCQVLMISMFALLAGATDPDGDRLTITGLSSTSGTLTPTEDGGWTFERDAGMLGEVNLTYTISDGSASVVQTAYFSVVEAPPIIGTADDDNLLGTNCGETIDGRAGDDNIDARGGNDTIIGRAGDDHIIAGSGNDVVYAGAGNDVVFAGSGNDIVSGGAGDDRLYGEDGDDTIMGDDGDDFLSGGPGADILVASIGNDTLHGNIGDDTLDGGIGDDNLDGGEDDDVIMGGADDDCLSGGDGNDVLSDGTGEDTVHGGAGSDYITAAADAADDVYDGGDGQDTLDYSTATFSITVDLGRGRANGQDVGHDLIEAFEEVLAGSGDDHIIAGSTSVSMTGGKGRDTFEFQRSDDDDPQAMTVRKITDFTVGDRIVAATYEISYLQDDEDDEPIADMFDDIYLSQGGNRPVRFRFEKHDDDDVTFVDVHDRPDSDEFYSIEVSGHHHLQFTVAVT